MKTTHHFAPRALLRRCLPLLLAACFAPGQSGAAPVPPQVVAGQATFTQQGNVFSITNTPNTIINWQSFSIAAGDITRFIQQSSDSAVLNRIVGQDPSRILGALQSNGHVFLINPNGIVFGRDARVDVNGLTASTLNLTNADFLAGRRHFSAGAVAGNVDNQGAITTPSGGKVFLLAPNVANSGIITSPQGEVVLAAGHSVQLVDSGNPDLHVVVSAPASEALNLGSVVAQGGRIGIYGALVRQRGLVNADSAHLDASGRIVFRASGDTLLDAGSVTSARGAGQGGAISLQGERVGLTGNAQVDASGQLGGGSVQAGGSYQGRDPQVRNASQTLLSPGAGIRADALTSGKGGQVVLWSNGATRAYGSISARGPNGGGVVETSGHYLDVLGLAVDAGHGGTWLLDPYDVVIGNNGSTVPLSSVQTFTSGQSTGAMSVDSAMLNSAAPSTNIVVQATHDILVDGAIARPAGTTGGLTLQAGNNITIDAPIATAGGALTLSANTAPYASGFGSILVNAAINTAGGQLSMSANGIGIGARAPSAIDSGSGNIALNAVETLLLSANSTLSSAGRIDLVSDQMSLPGKIGPSQGARPALSINTATSDRSIEISNATGSSSALLLAPSQLNAIFARQLTIGNASYQGNIRVAGQLGGTTTPFESPGLSLETLGAIDITAPVFLRADTASNLMLNRVGSATGGITLSQGATLSADNVTLLADNMAIGAGVNASGVSGGSISLMPASGGALIMLGAGAADGSGQLGLDSAELAFLSARKVSIGGQAGQTGNVNLVSGINMSQLATDSKLDIKAGSGDLSLQGRLVTPGALLLSGARISNITSAAAAAASISLKSSVQIGDVSAPLFTETTFLNADNTHPGGSAPINIRNTGTLNLGKVTQSGTANSGAITIANNGGMTVLKNEPAQGPAVVVQSSGGAINLSTQSPLTINGAVISGGGAVNLTAGNGGLLTVGSGGSVASGAGNMVLTGGSVLNQGSLSSTSGNITLLGNPVTSTGTVTTVSGTITGVPPTLTACIANPALAGCSAVLPTLAQCTSAPSTPGCSVVLPSLAQCTAAPATPGCSAVLPTIAQCTAAPSTPGCGVVLPTLAQCTAAPSTPGCSVVLPSIAQCTAAPSTPGCQVVLPSVAACVANPSAPGCSAVLPSLAVCTAAPSTAGCSVVLPSLAACTAAPSTAGCSAVLPSLAVCTSAPSTAGCSAVLPSLAVCTSAPSTAGCSAVLPSLALCTSAPSTAGCSAVLPSLAVCTSAPSTAGCSAVLPSLALCTVSPATAGCSAVLPSLAFCIAAPTTAGCSAVLPTLAVCTATPTTPGCGVVLPSLAQCTAAPATAGCSAVLPALSACIANPQLGGCVAVLPSLAQCVANPATPGCSVILPTVAQCVASPTLAGCSVVLPSLAQCSATPTLAGCSVVLPSLAQCTINPGLQGCGVVLPSLSQCISNKLLAGCVAVLPSVPQCVASPSLSGCAVVLPSLSQCVAAPTAAGCSVVLPTLAQCVGSPGLQGCSVVLPSVTTCVAAPATAGCTVVVPPAQTTPGTPGQQLSNETINTVAASSGTVLASVSGGKSVDKADQQQDSTSVAGISKPLGEASELRKKTYCN